MDLLKVGDRTLQSTEIMPMLSQFGLLPRLIQEVVIEGAVASIELTPEEIKAAEAQFCQRNQITSNDEAQAWARQRYCQPSIIRTLAVRDMQLAKFKQETFEKEIDSYFLQRKARLDRVLYSLIRTTQAGLAQELYFRVHDDGQSFADLAREYSEGQEAKTGGLIGPVELSVPHPNLAGLLSISQPGQVWPPKRIGEWYIVVRLEKFFPAQLDDAMRQRLMDELFQQWMKEQLQNTPVSIPAPDTIAVPAEAVPTMTNGETNADLEKAGVTANSDNSASSTVASAAATAEAESRPETAVDADLWS